MKKYILILLISFPFTCTYAQWDDASYEKEKEVSTPFAPSRDQMRQLWAAEDEMMKQRKFSFSFPDVPVRQGGVQIDYGSSSNSTSQKRSSSRSSVKDNIRSNDERNAQLRRENWQRHLDNMEQARKRREEEKRRKREEDDRRERSARIRHSIITSPMYQNAAIRDHWHATEGARMIDQIKAKDLVKWPQKRETSGAELAAGIKPKKEENKGGSITFVSEQVLKTKKSYDGQNEVVDPSGEGAMDENQVGSWIDTFEKPDLLNWKNTKKKTKIKKPIMLVHRDELRLDSLNMFVLPQYGLVAVSGDSLIVLKDTNLSSISWLNNKSYDHVISCGRKLIGKRDSTLYLIEEKEALQIIKYNTNDFSIFSHDENSILVMSWNEGLTTVMLVDIEKKTYTELLRIPYVIWSITSNGSNIYAIVENSLCVIDEKGYPLKIYTNDLGLNDITFSPYGLLVATDENILYVKSKGEMGVFFEKGAKRLWTDSQGVYALSCDYDLIYFKQH